MGCDCSFAKNEAFRSGNHMSFGYDHKTGDPVSQQVWHKKEPTLLEAKSAIKAWV
jgi:hypothetical protein